MHSSEIVVERIDWIPLICHSIATKGNPSYKLGNSIISIAEINDCISEYRFKKTIEFSNFRSFTYLLTSSTFSPSPTKNNFTSFCLHFISSIKSRRNVWFFWILNLPTCPNASVFSFNECVVRNTRRRWGLKLYFSTSLALCITLNRLSLKSHSPAFSPHAQDWVYKV